jgi:hypothetical protein
MDCPPVVKSQISFRGFRFGVCVCVGMREVVARCLNKDLKKRPTAKELLEHKSVCGGG